MRRFMVCGALIVLLLAAVPAFAASSRLSARVSGLPNTQSIGQPYPLVVTVENSGKWINFFCLDFNDDNDSWAIKGPAGLTAYPKSDGFCVKVLKGGTTNFRFTLIATKSGRHKLEVLLGKGHVYECDPQQRAEGQPISRCVKIRAFE